METRVQQKIDDHNRNFKTQLRDWLLQHNASIVSGKSDVTSEFLQFMFDSENIQLQREDFQRRKRVKNHVPFGERCCAKRANGDQCTRRRLDGTFCGTHSKGAPHGVVEENAASHQQNLEKVEIWLQVIQGISYYVDQHKRVYSPEDIVSNQVNPRVIGRWESDVGADGDIQYRLVLGN
jgi:hypothetical protein